MAKKTRLEYVKNRFKEHQDNLNRHIAVKVSGKASEDADDNISNFTPATVREDWKRRNLKEFSFNGSPPFDPVQVPDAPMLTLGHISTAIDKLDIHPNLKTYINECASQSGFMNTSNWGSFDYFLQEKMHKMVPNLDKGNAIFIENGDGSFTFIEVTYIESLTELVVSESPKQISNPDGRPLAISITTSLVTQEQIVDGDPSNVKIKHELKDDKILLLDPVAKNWINKDDTMELVDCCGLSDDKVQTLIDNDVNKHLLKLLKCEVNLLNQDTQIIADNDPSHYRVTAKNIAIKSEELLNKNAIEGAELPDAIKFCKATRALVKNETEETKKQFQIEAQNIATKPRSTPYAAMVRGSLLGLLGVTLLAASVAVAVTSLGGGMPLAVGGALLATEALTAAAAAVGYTALSVSVFGYTTLSLGMAIKGGLTLWNSFTKPQVADLAKGTKLLQSPKQAV